MTVAFRQSYRNSALCYQKKTLDYGLDCVKRACSQLQDTISDTIFIGNAEIEMRGKVATWYPWYFAVRVDCSGGEHLQGSYILATSEVIAWE